ncbi:hypothetical protein PR048_029398, partial [Dryococelus australis]
MAAQVSLKIRSPFPTFTTLKINLVQYPNGASLPHPMAKLQSMDGIGGCVKCKVWQQMERCPSHQSEPVEARLPCAESQPNSCWKNFTLRDGVASSVCKKKKKKKIVKLCIDDIFTDSELSTNYGDLKSGTTVHVEFKGKKKVYIYVGICQGIPTIR